MLEHGLAALQKSGTLDAKTAGDALALLRDKKHTELIRIVGDRLARTIDPKGRYPAALAKWFSAGPMDLPEANLQRFLMAMDILASLSMKPDEMAQDAGLRAYLRGLARREEDRRALQQTLAGLGWKIVGVPSLSDTDRGINYVNGVHLAGRYLMPAYGGFYKPLDRAAAAALGAALGPVVRVVPIRSAVSQQGLGAVHCAVAVWPDGGSE